jgi:hypothetical protein
MQPNSFYNHTFSTLAWRTAACDIHVVDKTRRTHLSAEQENCLQHLNVSNDNHYSEVASSATPYVLPNLQHSDVARDVSGQWLETCLLSQHVPSFFDIFRAGDVVCASVGVTVAEYVEKTPILTQITGMASMIVKYSRTKCAESITDRSFVKPSSGIQHSILYEIKHNETSPFLADIKSGAPVLAVENNMFIAPLVCHAPPERVFVLELQDDGLYTLRKISCSVSVGQVEPKLVVPRPGSSVSRNIVRKLLLTYLKQNYSQTSVSDRSSVFELVDQPVKVLKRSKRSAAHKFAPDDATVCGDRRVMKFKESRLVELFGKQHENVIRSLLLKEPWCLRSGSERNDGVMYEVVSAPISSKCWSDPTPEDVCLLLCMHAAQSRLRNVGIRYLTRTVQMQQVQQEIRSENSFGQSLQRSRHIPQYLENICAFITQQLQITPWSLSKSFVSAKSGKTMLRLQGRGNPFGKRQGYSFLESTLRANANASTDPKCRAIQMMEPHRKSGTQADLRKLNTAEVHAKLAKYGVAKSVIEKLQRWDGVKMLRQLANENELAREKLGTSMFVRHMKTTTQTNFAQYRLDIQTIFSNMVEMLGKSADYTNEDIDDPMFYIRDSKKQVSAVQVDKTDKEEYEEFMKSWCKPVDKVQYESGPSEGEVKDVSMQQSAAIPISLEAADKPLRKKQQRSKRKQIVPSRVKGKITTLLAACESNNVSRRVIGRFTVKRVNRDGSQTVECSIIEHQDLEDVKLDLRDGGCRFKTVSGRSIKSCYILG